MAAKKSKSQDRKVDISKVLRACDMNDREFWSKLTDDERKSISFYVITRFLSATSPGVDQELSQWYLTMANNLLNVHANELRHHQELLWKLACAVGIGHPIRHTWVAPSRPKQKKTPTALVRLLRERYPHYKSDEIDLLVEINTVEDFLELAEQSAWSEKDVQSLRKDLVAK